MAIIVADTDVLIDFLAGVAPVNRQVRAEMQRGSLVTTVISRFELLSGARDVGEEQQIHALLADVPTWPLDNRAAERAAATRQSLERSGLRIEVGDCLIAGIVLAHGALLMTRNRAHFSRVKGLRLVDIAT